MNNPTLETLPDSPDLGNFARHVHDTMMADQGFDLSIAWLIPVILLVILAILKIRNIRLINWLNRHHVWGISKTYHSLDSKFVVVENQKKTLTGPRRFLLKRPWYVGIDAPILVKERISRRMQVITESPVFLNKEEIQSNDPT